MLFEVEAASRGLRLVEWCSGATHANSCCCVAGQLGRILCGQDIPEDGSGWSLLSGSSSGPLKHGAAS